MQEEKSEATKYETIASLEPKTFKIKEKQEEERIKYTRETLKKIKTKSEEEKLELPKIKKKEAEPSRTYKEDEKESTRYAEKIKKKPKRISKKISSADKLKTRVKRRTKRRKPTVTKKRISSKELKRRKKYLYCLETKNGYIMAQNMCVHLWGNIECHCRSSFDINEMADIFEQNGRHICCAENCPCLTLYRKKYER